MGRVGDLESRTQTAMKNEGEEGRKKKKREKFFSPVPDTLSNPVLG